MESRAIKIHSRYSNKVVMKIIPGHFATTHSHINYYIDITTLKIRQTEASEAARCLAANYSVNTPVDTIVCMDGMEVIGAFLAQWLTENCIHSLNTHKSMYVVTPEIDVNRQIIFRDNVQNAIYNKNVLLLLASATTGKTVMRCMDCINYYGGRIVGISAVFSALPEIEGQKVYSLFSTKDIPRYQTYSVRDCPFCQKHQKLDAIVNSYGYSRL